MTGHRLVMVWVCWRCRKEVVDGPLPDGWRETTRGFAGKVYLCDECDKPGKRRGST